MRDFFEAQTEGGVECVVASSCWLGTLVFEYSIRDFLGLKRWSGARGPLVCSMVFLVLSCVKCLRVAFVH
jgi:hypothetical protein